MAHPVSIETLRLYTAPRYRHTGTHVRGAVLAAYPDRELLHNHLAPARIPTVRFHAEGGNALVFAYGAEAREVLDELAQGLRKLPTPHLDYEVTAAERGLLSAEVAVGGCYRYQSTSPWLALNQENHRRYLAADAEGRRRLLGRILVGNVLTTLGSLGIRLTPEERLVLEVEEWREESVELGGTRYLGFDVLWQGNLRWVPWLGIGKQCAKGFGLFEPSHE